jgi:hypothetical protein
MQALAAGSLDKGYQSGCLQASACFFGRVDDGLPFDAFAVIEIHNDVLWPLPVVERRAPRVNFENGRLTRPIKPSRSSIAT